MHLRLEEGDVLVEGVKFHYCRTPVGHLRQKPTFVLQHGSSDNGTCWEPVAQELAASYDVLMPDARGHGRSARLNPGEPLDQAADLASLLRALGVEKAIVAGHSMGAQIVSRLATRFPHMVCAAILEDPPWFIPGPETEQVSDGGVDDDAIVHWRRVQGRALQEAVEECHAEHPSWPDSYVVPWCRAKREWDLNFLKVKHDWGVGWKEEVSSHSCPVLLITADPLRGAIVTPEVVKIVTTLNPRIQVANFPEAGHQVRFAAHGAYIEKVMSFLEGIGLGRSRGTPEGRLSLNHLPIHPPTLPAAPLPAASPIPQAALCRSDGQPHSLGSQVADEHWTRGRREGGIEQETVDRIVTGTLVAPWKHGQGHAEK